MGQPLGTFTFVLHSHIPYVLAHGVSPHGTDWLSEAAVETYLPLLETMHRLIAEGISPQITLGLTPVLVEQLRDSDFQAEFEEYLKSHVLQAKADQEEFRTEDRYHMAYLARYWEDWYSKGLMQFVEWHNRDIIGAFKALQDAGHIEIITSSATHGYSPLLSQDTTVQAQIGTGVEAYRRVFGRQPRGYWLPECAYRPRYEWAAPSLVPGEEAVEPVLRKGVDEFLAEAGIEYFFADSHLLKGNMRGSGVYADKFSALSHLWQQFEKQFQAEKESFSPYYSYVVNSSGHPQQKVSVFARDPETGIQVWSGDHGYPGDEWYLEFHKKHLSKQNASLGLRYWRISTDKSDIGNKGIYQPHHAEKRAKEHADHFVELVHKVLATQAPAGDGILCATYDTELFGHWWYEGPQFLYHAIKAMASSNVIKRATCGAYLDAEPKNNVQVTLPEGSWGEGGFHYIWLNEETAWAWKEIYHAEVEMVKLLELYGDNPKYERILKQAARELLLLSASDWPFCISSGGAKDYSEVRIRNHNDNFMAIADLIERSAAGGFELTVGDWKNVAECETRDRIFEEIDLSLFSKVKYPVIP
jgi:1,4-alpha-glucan branching enzyme